MSFPLTPPNHKVLVIIVFSAALTFDLANLLLIFEFHDQTFYLKLYKYLQVLEDFFLKINAHYFIKCNMFSKNNKEQPSRIWLSPTVQFSKGRSNEFLFSSNYLIWFPLPSVRTRPGQLPF